MTDIVERLRGPSPLAWVPEAIDEIERLRGVEQDAVEWVEERTKRLRDDNERLRAQVKRQRAALAQIMAPRYHDAWVALQDARDIARAALEVKDD